MKKHIVVLQHWEYPSFSVLITIKLNYSYTSIVFDTLKVHKIFDQQPKTI
jgi:hypothetical protein